MNLANIQVSDVIAQSSGCDCITSGMIGATVTFVYTSPIWDGLRKTAVFAAGNVTRDVLNAGEVVAIPAEILRHPYVKLFAGIYGTDENGELVIPTVMAPVGMIWPGADPSGDSGADPELPIWAQLQRDIEALKLAGGVSAFGPEDAGRVLYIASDGSVQTLGLGDGLDIVEGVLTLTTAAGERVEVMAEITDGICILRSAAGWTMTAELSGDGLLRWPGVEMQTDLYGVVAFEEE